MSFFLSSSGLLSSSYKHCCDCTSTAEAPRLQLLFLLPSTSIDAILLPQHMMQTPKTETPHVLLPVVIWPFVVILQALLRLYFHSNQTSVLLPSTSTVAIVLPQHRLAHFKNKDSTCPSSCRHPAFCHHPTRIVAILLPEHKQPHYSPCSFSHLQALVRSYFHSIRLQTSKKQRLHMSFFLSSSGLLSSSYEHCWRLYWHSISNQTSILVPSAIYKH